MTEDLRSAVIAHASTDEIRNSRCGRHVPAPPRRSSEGAEGFTNDSRKCCGGPRPEGRGADPLSVRGPGVFGPQEAGGCSRRRLPTPFP